ncbi:hypothetical protein V2W30_04580 [Streptomyces sp. Q6]|uniref:Uncharacterized protein n=1 Tax=Streptomyces citrinus TaxID=3118173 RepID=A0ACD5A684_9ACTN
MTREKRHDDEDTQARTAVESVLDEFERAQTDPRHREEKDRRRGESGDALTPDEEAQEQAHGE